MIRNTNFTKEGALDDSDIANLDVEVKKFEKRRLQFGDIILEKSGGGPKQPVGRVALFDKDDGLFSFSNFTSAIRVKNPNELDFRFLHKQLFWTYLSGVTEGMQSHSTGIRNLDGDAYKAIQIEIPPLPEQHRIAAILDEAFDGIAIAKANAENNLQNARALFESHLHSIFTEQGEGWVEAALGDVCAFENGDRGKNYPNRNEYVDSGIPWINTGHIQPDGSLSENDMNFITKEKFDTLRSGKIQPGDLVYCLRGATLGKTALVEPFAVGAVASSLVIIRPRELMDRRFLYYFLTSPMGKSLIKLYDNGAAQPNLGAKSVAKYNVPLPKVGEQKGVVKILDALVAETQRLEFLYQQKLTALDALKKSLLHQAFSGHL
ncbi:restriction endonuclease subunit S [Accumulibacter sp.]|uniref:restriction endonuclease subunit S n=1 Tax=Accumulibacter sp. TaxID=2053492 RepID=UPI002C9A2CF0|nr:restriction endonuclease subunit S [Accumulibacter sp.]HPU80830.1 restriction endonuclease subunit S [Accumulibacter sp.]